MYYHLYLDCAACSRAISKVHSEHRNIGHVVQATGLCHMRNMYSMPQAFAIEQLCKLLSDAPNNVLEIKCDVRVLPAHVYKRVDKLI